MAVLKAALGKWDKVFEQFKIPTTHGNKHHPGPCPVCRKKGKFRLYPNWVEFGGWVCVCGSGNGFDLIQKSQRLNPKEAAKAIYNIVGHLEQKPTAKRQRTSYLDTLEPIRRFHSMEPVKGSEVEQYLSSRGITVLPQLSVKYCTREVFFGKTYLPCMYAIATTDEGDIAYAHTTFLYNGSKYRHKDAKKLKKITETYDVSIAARLFTFKHSLGIAEGIETALSATQLFGVPTWATLTSGFMKKFMAPEGVRILNIFADNDNNGTGLAAAFECGRKNILSQNEVETVHIFWTNSRGDINDALSGKIENHFNRETLTK